jgi:biopolymer transport protein ExbD
MTFKERKKRNVQLDITPVVDTVFNLLIFFALSLNFTSSAALPVNLPEVSSSEKIAETGQVVIQITSAGVIFLDQESVSARHLQEKLQHARSKASQCVAIIQADEQVSHGRVVRVMDMCRKAGFTKISIAAALRE